jgi:hypothetical protein
MSVVNRADLYSAISTEYRIATQDVWFGGSRHNQSAMMVFLDAPVHTARIAAYIVFCLGATLSSEHMRLNPTKQRGLLNSNDVVALFPCNLRNAAKRAMTSVHAFVQSHIPNRPSDSLVPSCLKQGGKAENNACHLAMK